MASQHATACPANLPNCHPGVNWEEPLSLSELKRFERWRRWITVSAAALSKPNRPHLAACTEACRWGKLAPTTAQGGFSMRTAHTKLALALLASVALVAEAQAQASYPCVNDAPNPYKLQSNWAQTPRPWGPTNSVTVDAKDNVSGLDRCGDNGCLRASESPIFHLGPDGKTIKNFGAGEFVSAHAITVDKHRNVWAADFQAKDGKGMQVIKFSPDGKVLLKLGKAGESAMAEDRPNQPTGLP